MRILLVAVITCGAPLVVAADELPNPPNSVFDDPAVDAGPAITLAQNDGPRRRPLPIGNFQDYRDSSQSTGTAMSLLGNIDVYASGDVTLRGGPVPRLHVPDFTFAVGQEFYQSGAFKTLGDDGTFVEVGVSIPIGGPGLYFPGNTGFANEGNSTLSSDLDPSRPDRSLEAEFLAFGAVLSSLEVGVKHTNVNLDPNNRINQFGTPANPIGIDGRVEELDGLGIYVGPNVLFPVTVGRQQFVFSTGVRGTFTAWNPDITVDQRFLPNNPTVFVAPGFNPGGQEFGGGVELRFGLKTILVDRILVGVVAGLGKQWTDVVQGDSSAIDSVFVGGTVELPFITTSTSKLNIDEFRIFGRSYFSPGSHRF